MGHAMKIKVILADDHPAVLAAMEELLADLPNIAITGRAENSSQVVQLLTKVHCDVLVVDFSMPGGHFADGVAMLRFIQRRFPDTRIVVVTAFDTGIVIQSVLEAGVNVIVSKSDECEVFATAVHAAIAYDEYLSPRMRAALDAHRAATPTIAEPIPLTRRELEVIRLFTQGLTVMAISRHLKRSRKTISTQKLIAMNKLGLATDADLFNFAAVAGLASSSQASRALIERAAATEDAT